MLTKRIIPCLDIKNGEVVKGVNFVNLIYAGNAIELAKFYSDNGADELVFLDITATNEKRKTLVELVKNISKYIRIPFTVGGGISSINDIEEIIKSGADKVSLNSAIIKNPSLISLAANQFGSQAVVAAIDAKLINNDYFVFINAGQVNTNINVIDWCKKVADYGAGEILLTSMDKDGTKSGFDNKLLNLVCDAVNIPIIASGGAGSKDDFYVTFNETKTDACLAASLFHYGELSINDLKKYLFEKGIMVRL